MKAAKIDAIQPECVNAALGQGCSWQSTAMIGRGTPDGVLGVPTDTGLCLNLWIEFKSEKAGTIAGEPNEDQVKWAERWRGQKPAVIRSVEEMLLLIKNARLWASMLVRQLEEVG